MEVVCPECHAPHEAETPEGNRLHCPKCKTVFLAPMELMTRIRLEELTTESKRLEQRFKDGCHQLEQQYRSAKTRLDQECGKFEAECRTAQKEADAKIVKKPIAKKFLKIVLSIYGIVVLSVTLMLMAYQYRHAKTQIFQDLKSSERIFQTGLGDALWNVDPVALGAQLAGMLEHPAIVGVKVLDDMGAIAGTGGVFLDESKRLVSHEGRVTVGDDVQSVPVDPQKKGISQIFGHHFTIVYTSEQGEAAPVGAVTVYSSNTLIFERLKIGYVLLLINTVIVAVALIVTLLWVSRMYLSQPLSVLTRAVTDLNLDNLDNLEVDVQTADHNELKILEKSYNHMVSNLIAEKKRIMQMSATFEKFVPKQFLSRIADQGINTIKLGHMQSERLTILYSKIQGFDTLSKQMGSQGIFSFLNAYLAAMEAPIEKHGGFIYQLQPNSIMALFDLNDRAMEAVSSVYAAIDMQKALGDFNRRRPENDHSTIDIQIGIHTGKVTFGTLGNETRLDPTLIGDAIETAMRLQGAALNYNSQIVISQDTFGLLASDDAFQWRELDLMQIEGHEAPLRIYEVFDADPVLPRKQRIREDFHKGLRAVETRDWDQAARFFQKCLDRYPLDRVSQMYVKRCLDQKADGNNIGGFLKIESTIFKGLPETILSELAPCFEQIAYKKGDAVIRKGEDGTAFYVVFDGSLEVFIDEDLPVAELTKGECFGEMALMTGQPTGATIKAKTPGLLLSLSAKRFHEMLRQHPSLNSHFFKLFLKRTTENQDL